MTWIFWRVCRQQIWLCVSTLQNLFPFEILVLTSGIPFLPVWVDLTTLESHLVAQINRWSLGSIIFAICHRRTFMAWSIFFLYCDILSYLLWNKFWKNIIRIGFLRTQDQVVVIDILEKLVISFWFLYLLLVWNFNQLFSFLATLLSNSI